MAFFYLGLAILLFCFSASFFSSLNNLCLKNFDEFQRALIRIRIILIKMIKGGLAVEILHCHTGAQPGWNFWGSFLLFGGYPGVLLPSDLSQDQLSWRQDHSWGQNPALIPAWRIRGFSQDEAEPGGFCGVRGGNSLPPGKVFELLGLFSLFFFSPKPLVFSQRAGRAHGS